MNIRETTLEDIETSLYALALKDGRILSKKDIEDFTGVPSYNTCVRRGFRLTPFNRKIRESLYKLENKCCKQCNEPIPFERRQYLFCGHSCSAKFNNPIGRRKPRKNARPIKVPKSSAIPEISMCIGENCIWCGQLINNKRHKQPYCSSVCHKADAFAAAFIDWFYHGATRTNKVIRRFLEAWKGYRCEICGISSWNGKDITLEVEHISGDSSDSSPENVCLICPNCHSQTPTYKGRNIGNGRYKRLVRYHEGKSY